MGSRGRAVQEPSSVPGGTCEDFVTATGSMPGYIGSSSTPAPTSSAALRDGGSRCRSTRSNARSDDLARVADREQIERAFLELTVEHRSVLVLTHYVGLPAAEVGRDPRHPDRHGLLTPPPWQSGDAGLTGRAAGLDAAHRLGARTMNESMDRALADWLREGPEHGAQRESLERCPCRDPSGRSQRPGWTFPERWLPMQLTLPSAR